MGKLANGNEVGFFFVVFKYNTQLCVETGIILWNRSREQHIKYKHASIKTEHEHAHSHSYAHIFKHCKVSCKYYEKSKAWQYVITATVSCLRYNSAVARHLTPFFIFISCLHRIYSMV